MMDVPVIEEKVMSVPKSQLLATPEEYLAFERESLERHEWLDGLIYGMAGESPEHSIICSNVNAILNIQLRGKPCAAFSPNMKVYTRLPTDTTLKGLFSYPDALVVCGKPLFHDEHRDVLINPQVIVEVLSDSTGNYDRNRKFERYSQNASLTDYILISQYRPKLEHFVRRANGHWDYYCQISMAGAIYIASIECSLPPAEVYDRIEFKSEEAPDDPLIRQG